jgi:hypothetical protein
MCRVGLRGWGATHSLQFDLAADWFNGNVKDLTSSECVLCLLWLTCVSSLTTCSFQPDHV